jgi:transposase
VVYVARSALLAIVKRPRHTQGFQVMQWRWAVERTFGWRHRLQRWRKDFEALLTTAETWIRIAMIHLMVRHLTARA